MVAAVWGRRAELLAALLDEVLPARLALMRAEVDAGRLAADALVEMTALWRDVRAAADRSRAARASAAGGSDTPAKAAMGPQWIGTADVAALLGVKPRRARQILHSGAIPRRKVGGAWLAHRPSVLAYRDRER